MTAELVINPATQYVSVAGDDTPTPSVIWDRAIQQAVINTAVGPTISARAYGLLHTAMYDAWAAYSPNGVATQLWNNLQRPTPEHTDANKTEAMSYAAYRVATELFPGDQALFDSVMEALGFDPTNSTTDTTTPAGIGNVSAEALMGVRRVDGSNQLGGYGDTTGYTPVNSSPDAIVDITRWTPERVPIDSNGELQEFLTPQWGDIVPFALGEGSQVRPVPPQPFLLPGVEGSVDFQARTIALADGSVLPIDRTLIGTVINPAFIEQAENVVEISANLSDEDKLIAEFWEDGAGTSFPPGTFQTFGQFVSARDDNSLDEDALLFFALGNAAFDASIATWEAKVFYDYARPVRLIRDLGRLGLIGTPGVDSQTGETGFVIDAWLPNQGTQTILAENFLSYQDPLGEPSPPFGEYTSGHSAFGTAAVEVLQSFTGSNALNASVTFLPGQSRFEPGLTPQEPLTLEWDELSDIGSENGISRLFGGIHFTEGDLNGRSLGTEAGALAWQVANGYALLGENGLTYVRGSEGNDVLTAGGDATFAFGFGGDDVLTGSPEADILFGNAGSDVLIGGAGADQFLLAPESGVDTIVDFEKGVDRILLGGGLTFETLAIADSTVTLSDGSSVPVVELRTGTGLLARLANVSAIALDGSDFI